MDSTIKREKARRRTRAVDDSRGSENDATGIAVTTFVTGLQWMAIAWKDDALQGVVFGHASSRQAADTLIRLNRLSRHACRMVAADELVDEPKWVRQLVDDLQRFADGEPIDFADVPISQAHLTQFGRRIIAACRRIRWGQTSSYGGLAAKCGATGAARAVGSVMAKDRFPLVVPCHRVLAAGGRLGGYSAPGGLQRKKELLAMETSDDQPFRLSNSK
jgi:methylated-DNA-[protein]-cysteine S-methyltransferase